MFKKNFLVFISLMFIAIIFTSCGDAADKNIQLVKNGTMDNMPNVPIGKAFDQFFSNGKWTSFKSTDNKQMVEFNGNCLFLDEQVSMKIQFEILNDTRFALYYVGMDGEDLPDVTRPDVLNRILEDYKP